VEKKQIYKSLEKVSSSKTAETATEDKTEMTHIKNLDVRLRGKLIHSKLKDLEASCSDSVIISPEELLSNGYAILATKSELACQEDPKSNQNSSAKNSALLELCQVVAVEKPKVTPY
jgi:hypothetical protein